MLTEEEWYRVYKACLRSRTGPHPIPEEDFELCERAHNEDPERYERTAADAGLR